MSETTSYEPVISRFDNVGKEPTPQEDSIVSLLPEDENRMNKVAAKLKTAKGSVPMVSLPTSDNNP